MLFRVLTRSRRCDAESGRGQDRKCPSRRTVRLALAALLAAVSLLFTFSIPPRASLFGTLPLQDHGLTLEGVTPGALRIVDDWLREPAPLNLHFPLYIWPQLTVEDRHLGDDDLTLYFPFFMMPLYVPAKLLGLHPTVAWTAFYGLLNHWIVALLGSMLVFSAVLSASRKLVPALLLSLASACMLIFHPAPMFFFETGYWADMLVIPLFVVMALLESFRDTALAEDRSPRHLDLLIAASILMGVLTDWFAVSVFLAIIMKRLCFWQWGRHWKAIRRNLLLFSVPVFLAAIFLLLQLLIVKGVPGLLVPFRKFHVHGAFGSNRAFSWDNFDEAFWGGSFQSYYGWSVGTIIWLTLVVSGASLVAFAVAARRRQTAVPGAQMRLMGTSFVLVASCLLHTYLLLDHAAENQYSVLKFVVPLSCASMTLLPAVLAMMAKQWLSSKILTLGAAVVLAAAGIAAVANIPWYSMIFLQGTCEYERLGHIIKKNVRGRDYVIAPRLRKGDIHWFQMAKFSGSYGFAILFDTYHIGLAEHLKKPTDPIIVVAPEPLTEEETALRQRAAEAWSSDGLQFMRLPVSELSRPDNPPHLCGPVRNPEVEHIREGGWPGMKGKLNLSKTPAQDTRGAIAPGSQTQPGTRENAVSWTDRSRNFWLFGGYGHDGTGSLGFCNDLWKHDPATGNWTWMKGSSAVNQSGDYGEPGKRTKANTPGARNGAVSWTDLSGNLWLFGGWGYDSAGNGCNLNDLWKYDPTTGCWVWMKGASMWNRAGTYGTIGVPTADNTPGARRHAVSWTDRTGNLWLFGGWGNDGDGRGGPLNDLWKYDLVSGCWTWMKGASTANLPGNYGRPGASAATNTPGARQNAVAWPDGAGNLWLFGGWGNDGMRRFGSLNDLWKYDPTSGDWTWMKGASSVNQPGVYGVLGVPDTTNTPGGRQHAVSWTDRAGSLWLFGGCGYAAGTDTGSLNDLWKYDPVSGNWTWMKGASTPNQGGIYGTLGTPTAANTPGGRQHAVSWSDSSDNLWLSTGFGYAAGTDTGFLNDLWKYDPTSGLWTWMKGTSMVNQTGIYGKRGSPVPAKMPDVRYGAVGWTDNSGALWLFGGCGPDDRQREAAVSDLWKYDAATKDWALANDASAADRPAIYGLFGKAVTPNSPGAGAQAVSWVDSTGMLWFSSGAGYSSWTSTGNLNDKWRYDPSTGLWTWMKGVMTANRPGTDGTPGRSDARAYEVSWKNEWGTVWLFGGVGFDCSDYKAYLLDRWRDSLTDTPSPPPVIDLVGEPAATVQCGTAYIDAGATATDSNCMADQTGNIVVSNPVNVFRPGTYTVHYNARDGEGNSAAEVTRTVTVTDMEAPVITLSGETAVTVECGATYTEAGAICMDTCSGQLRVEVGGDEVNTGVPGTYTVTYNARDESCNSAPELTRLVTVADTAPVIVSRPSDTIVLADVNGNAPVPDFTRAFEVWDRCSGTATTTQSPPAGTIVAMGSHAITLTATDRAGHSAACNVTLTVREAQSQATYDGSGAEADLVAGSGTLDVDTSAMAMTLDGATVASGADEGGVCVFRFKEVNVASGVEVKVAGVRPLSVAASGDLVWLANLDVPPGTLGGGDGGAGGNGARGGTPASGGAEAVPAGVGSVGAAGYGGYGTPGAGGSAGDNGIAGTRGGAGGNGGQGGAAQFNVPVIETTLAAGNGGGGGGGGGADSSGGSAGGAGAKGAGGGGAFILSAQGLLQVTGGRFSVNAAEPAAGGVGGAGSGGGTGGQGGAGGCGTPGRIQLVGSVVLAEGRTVRMHNTLDKHPDHNGRFTRFSNMNPEMLTAHAPSLDKAGGAAEPLAGENVYDTLLKSNNPLLMTASPKIPELVGGPATAGCLKSNYWNQGDVNALIPGNGQLRYTVLRQPSSGGASVFSGYDQVFVRNTSDATIENVAIAVKGFPARLLPEGSTGTGVAGRLPAGCVWTTTVPAGAVVVVYTKPGIVPASQTVNAKARAQFAVATASSNIALACRWRHNGVELANDGKYSGVDTATLRIGNCLKTDEGLYTCMITEPGVGAIEIISSDQGGTLAVSDTAR